MIFHGEHKSCSIGEQPQTWPYTLCNDLSLGTQKGHKHKHFIGTSLPYWTSLYGVFMRYPYPHFCLFAFLGPISTVRRGTVIDGLPYSPYPRSETSLHKVQALHSSTERVLFFGIPYRILAIKLAYPTKELHFLSA